MPTLQYKFTDLQILPRPSGSGALYVTGTAEIEFTEDAVWWVERITVTAIALDSGTSRGLAWDVPRGTGHFARIVSALQRGRHSDHIDDLVADEIWDRQPHRPVRVHGGTPLSIWGAMS